MLSIAQTMELTKKLAADSIYDTASWMNNHTEARQLMRLYGEGPIIIKHPGKWNTITDDMLPAVEIVDWCNNHDIHIGDFNFPVVIDEALTDCSAMFAYCRSFNMPVVIPAKAVVCRYMFYKCREYNQPIEFPEHVSSYVGALYMCDSLAESVTIHDNIGVPGELFRHATRQFISDSRTEEEAIYQANPVEVPAYIKLVRSD